MYSVQTATQELMLAMLDPPTLSPSPSSALDLPTIPTDTRTNTESLFTVDASMTRAGRKRKALDLYSLLVVCTCGQAVLESEISQNTGVIKCKRAGCETGWVS